MPQRERYEAGSLPDPRTRPMVDLLTACRALDITRNKAYQLIAHDGQLCEGVPVVRVGRTYRVATRALYRVLAMDVPGERAAG
jgi:hypothetical protein